MLESATIGLTVLERPAGDARWTLTPLAAGEALKLAEFGFEMPVDELYQDVDLPASETRSASLDSPNAAAQQSSR